MEKETCKNILSKGKIIYIICMILLLLFILNYSVKATNATGTAIEYSIRINSTDATTGESLLRSNI